eukprot:c37529_g1_i1 orf=41-211(+)
MKLVTWNVRGLSIMSRRRQLIQATNNLGVDVLDIQETKLSAGVAKGLNFLSRNHEV